jgi:polyisoprenoid-binding protein YceI
MRSLIKTTVILVLLGSLAEFPLAAAQDQVTLNLSNESRLWVDGTSNQSDWTVHAEELEGSITLQGDGVTQVRIEVPSGKMASKRSTIMDRLMHTALKAPQHPTIEFILSNPARSSSVSGESFSLDTKGRLSIAGQTRDIEMKVSGERLANGHIRFTGSYPLSMSDYGIAPPTAMFGALRTGSDVVVHFDIVGTPSSAASN